MKNLLHWKTTIIGIILLIVDFKYFNYNGVDKITFFGLLGIGLALLLLPDTFISSFKSWLKGFVNSNKDKKI